MLSFNNTIIRYCLQKHNTYQLFLLKDVEKEEVDFLPAQFQLMHIQFELQIIWIKNTCFK